jgi:histone H3-like centromeric protein A
MQNNDSAAATCTSFAPFVRLVKEITMDAPRGNGLRWQRDALVALQLATEDFLVMIFEMTYVPVVYVC